MSERAAEGPSSGTMQVPLSISCVKCRRTILTSSLLESHGKASDEFKECPTNAEPSLGYEGFGIAMKERIPSSDGQYREFEILLGREIQKSRRNSMVLFYKVFRVEHLPTSSYRIFVEFFLNSFKYFLYFDIPRNPDPKKSKKVRVIIYVQNKESPITTTCITRARVFGTKISEVLSTVSGEVSWTKLSWEFGTESDLASAQYDDDNFEYNAMEIRPGSKSVLLFLLVIVFCVRAWFRTWDRDRILL